MDTDRENRENRGAGTEALSDAQKAGQRLGDDASGLAQDTYDQARRAAEGQAERTKGAAASEVENVANALRKAAGDMRQGSPQERTFGQIADSLADASEAIRDRDLGQIAGDVSNFAKRNPLAFLGGAALAGFAVTRFAKASQSTPRGGSSEDDVPGRSGPSPDSSLPPRGESSPDSLPSRSGSSASGSRDPGAPATSSSSDVSSPAVATRGAIPDPATRPVPGDEGTAPATRPQPVTNIPEDRS